MTSPTAVRIPRWLRVVVPSLLLVAWLGAGAFGGPLFGRVAEVTSNDATTFLPSEAEATEVQKHLPAFLGDDVIPAIVVITDQGEGVLSDSVIATVQRQLAGLPESSPGVVSASPAITSQDGKALQVFVQLDATRETDEDVDAINSYLNTALAEGGLTHYVTGPAGFSAEIGSAFAGIDALLLGVALLAVLIILVIVYRAPLLAFAVLISSLFALCAALGTVWVLAREGVVLLNGQTQGILFILVIGAATDYGLLYVSRYREELRRHQDRGTATLAALRGAFEPILAAGGTVIAGLLCLLLSNLQSNRDLGPIAAIGIAFAMLSAFTLLPAMLFVFGRASYWPRAPRAVETLDGDGAEESEESEDPMPTRGVWRALPEVVAARPRRVWVGAGVLLVVACAGFFSFKADGVPQSDLVLGSSDARTGQALLARHFPAGSGSPVYVVAAADQRDAVARDLVANDGVASVAISSADSPAGVLPFTGQGFAAGAPTVVEGAVLLQVTLADAFDSPAAAQTVTSLRADLPSGVLVGGKTATEIDSNAASTHDRNLITPVVLVVILLILMLLLRSILAPVLLIATTVLSFGATLGVSALVFNHVFDFPGADPALPLFGFVFLVALGIDYNIFLMTRVREESLRHGTQAGISRGLAITGGVITSAGLVLAATFAALAVVPVLFLAQIAFIVAFGVLLDTFVVRTLLVPALAHDVGRRIWWPSALAKGQE